MKTLYFLLINLIIFSSTALAKSDWDGFYSSLMVGSSHGDVNENDSYLTGYTGDYLNSYRTTNNSDSSFNGTTFNLKLGINKEIESNLIGLELGGTLGSLEARNEKTSGYWVSTMFFTPGNESSWNGFIANTKINNYETFSARLGHIFNNSLLMYFKTGAAVGRIERRVTDNSGEFFDAGSTLRDKKNEVGYLLGLGAEYKMSNNFSFRLDYEYIDFGNVDFKYHGTAYTYLPGMSPTMKQSNTIDFSNFSAGICYLF